MSPNSYDFLGVGTAPTAGCSITSGIQNIPNSRSGVGVPLSGSLSEAFYTFTVTGLPAAGITATFYISIGCTVASVGPAVYVKNVALEYAAP